MSIKPSWLFQSIEITALRSAVFLIRRIYIANRQKNTELKRKQLGFRSMAEPLVF